MTLYVINPNSSDTVTSGIRSAVAPFTDWGHPIECLTLASGPKGIETQAQADRIIGPLLDLAAQCNDATGFVIACFGDPGLHALRDETDVPVIGIQEAAISLAMTYGQRIGVISILPGSVPRHLRSYGAMGVSDRIVADRHLGLSVEDLAHKGRTQGGMVRVAERLRDEDGADVLILGCAGMAQYRPEIEEATGLPVVEPCQAATAIALARIKLHAPERTSHAR